MTFNLNEGEISKYVKKDVLMMSVLQHLLTKESRCFDVQEYFESVIEPFLVIHAAVQDMTAFECRRNDMKIVFDELKIKYNSLRMICCSCLEVPHVVKPSLYKAWQKEDTRFFEIAYFNNDDDSYQHNLMVFQWKMYRTRRLAKIIGSIVTDNFNDEMNSDDF